MSVDLPEPFSPTRAWISPGRSARSKSDKATWPGNVLENPVISTTGSFASMTPSATNRPRFS